MTRWHQQSPTRAMVVGWGRVSFHNIIVYDLFVVADSPKHARLGLGVLETALDGGLELRQRQSGHCIVLHQQSLKRLGARVAGTAVHHTTRHWTGLAQGVHTRTQRRLFGRRARQTRA